MDNVCIVANIACHMSVASMTLTGSEQKKGVITWCNKSNARLSKLDKNLDAYAEKREYERNFSSSIFVRGHRFSGTCPATNRIIVKSIEVYKCYNVTGNNYCFSFASLIFCLRKMQSA